MAGSSDNLLNNNPTPESTSETNIIGNALPITSGIINTEKISNKENFIKDMTNYILTNQGPDNYGYAHPIPKRVGVEFLEASLNFAYRGGLNQDWRPYHFQGHVGTYKKENYVNELIIKKTEQVLVDKYKGDLVTLLTNVTADELFSPLIDRIGNREIKVPIAYLSKKFEESPYIFLKRYLLLTKQDQIYDLKPYHMTQIPRDALKDEAILKELLNKKAEQLLPLPKYKNDKFTLVTQITNEEMDSPFPDKLGPKTVLVSTRALMELVKYSPYNFARRYIDLNNIEELKELKPYHLQTKTQRGTFNDPKMIDELIEKSMDQVFLSQKYQGNVIKFMTEASMDEISISFRDKIAGRDVEVSLARVATKFSSDRYSMLMRYAEIKGWSDVKDLKRYHMKPHASRGTLADEELKNELVTKTIQHLLKTPKYNQNLDKLFDNLTVAELTTPFEDRVGPYNIMISFRGLADKFNHRTKLVVEHYKKINSIK